MPIYEYKCKKCGKITEELQPINDDPLTTCPHCSGELKRLISWNSSNVIYDAREQLEKEIKPEAKRIAERIKAGDEDAAADIFGAD
jgi:putative FmdB family regulatory protein